MRPGRQEKVIRLLVALLALALIAWLPPSVSYRDDVLIRWEPVCRHTALYWASMVGEQYPVRIAFGFYADLLPHVQPQVKIGSSWHYFKVEKDKVVLMEMEDSFKVKYYFTFVQFAGMHAYNSMKPGAAKGWNWSENSNPLRR